MSRSKVLVVSCKKDEHADFVISEFNSRGLGEEVVRLNTEDFVQNCEVAFDGMDFEIQLRDSDRTLRGREVQSVWYRRPEDFNLPEEADGGIREFVRMQASAFLRGCYFSCHDEALWVNPLPSLHRARIKLQQLKLAGELGFSLPGILVTNCLRKAANFAKKQKKICVKSLDEPTYTAGSITHALFTKVIDDLDVLEQHSASIKRCPVLFQQYIEKRCDIRVIVMGSKLFAFEIHSQDHPLAVHDFRGVVPDQLPHFAHELPKDIEQKVFRFVEEQGLRFSALDLVISKDGKYYFLENNANGQWLWLQFRTGVDLATPMIDLLFRSPH